MPARITNVDTERLITLYQSGLSFSQIAEVTDYSINVVRYRLCKSGIPIRPASEARTLRWGTDGDAIVKLYESGLNQQEIASELHVSYPTVSKYLKEANVRIRSTGEVRTGKSRPSTRKDRDWKCPGCGKIVRFKPHQIRKRKYCSRRCQGDNQMKPPITVTCGTCGSPFDRTPYKAARQTYCSIACARYAVHQRRRSGQKRPLERIVEALLLGLGLSYEQQWRLSPTSGMTSDFYLPAQNLAIECDGDYWHKLPNKIRDDLRKERAFREAGVRVLHLTETEVFTDPAACLEQIHFLTS